MTMVEMMITVAIVGVLATIGVVAYRRKVTSSKVTEATQMIENIRMAQDAYRAELGSYADVSASITSYYPAASPARFTTAWGGACGASCRANTEWSILTVQPHGPVQFGYATVAGTSASTPAIKGVSFTVNGTSVDLSALNGQPWYVVSAACDTDGNGVPVTLYSTSAGSDVMIDKEGE
jgi:type IV pilus assembly protein PilA